MKQKNLAVGLLAAVLLTALWWTMILKPVRAKASKVRADTADERSKLAPLEAQLNKAQRDATHAAQFKAQLDSLQLAMPDSPALAAFIRDANDIAQASGVAWLSVTHGTPTAGADGVASITIGIQIKGTYAQVLDYLSRLAALQRLVVVDGVQLSAAGSTGAGVGAGTGAGGGASSGGSTGPFSGSTQISGSISARMFATPDPATALATGASTASAPAATASPVPPAVHTGALNNS